MGGQLDLAIERRHAPAAGFVNRPAQHPAHGFGQSAAQAVACRGLGAGGVGEPVVKRPDRERVGAGEGPGGGDVVEKHRAVRRLAVFEREDDLVHQHGKLDRGKIPHRVRVDLDPVPAPARALDPGDGGAEAFLRGIHQHEAHGGGPAPSVGLELDAVDEAGDAAHFFPAKREPPRVVRRGVEAIADLPSVLAAGGRRARGAEKDGAGEPGAGGQPGRAAQAPGADVLEVGQHDALRRCAEGGRAAGRGQRETGEAGTKGASGSGGRTGWAHRASFVGWISPIHSGLSATRYTRTSSKLRLAFPPLALSRPSEKLVKVASVAASWWRLLITLPSTT